MVEVKDLVSRKYQEDLVKVHESSKWGTGGKHHVKVIKKYAKKIKAKTILDYGCGRGTLRLAMPLLPVAQYDPGIRQYSNLPVPADLVVCTDVLEHIEPDLLTNVLKHIRSLATRGAFMIIALDQAKLVLPDGSNAHKIIETPEWWINRVFENGFFVRRTELKKGLWLWLR